MADDQKDKILVNLRLMLNRMRHENEALQHLINALKEQNKSIRKNLNK
jgi:hypothetical protein